MVVTRLGDHVSLGMPGPMICRLHPKAALFASASLTTGLFFLPLGRVRTRMGKPRDQLLLVVRARIDQRPPIDSANDDELIRLDGLLALQS